MAFGRDGRSWWNLPRSMVVSTKIPMESVGGIEGGLCLKMWWFIYMPFMAVYPVSMVKWGFEIMNFGFFFWKLYRDKLTLHHIAICDYYAIVVSWVVYLAPWLVGKPYANHDYWILLDTCNRLNNRQGFIEKQTAFFFSSESPDFPFLASGLGSAGPTAHQWFKKT